ncbi:hypothetical protein SARC_11607 [Sphaeroforma arctica JP610]|uniref:J domain-containing protein n=1 Tax=Sphaeroforma arctica JP610 TaxID=667725 RepID=A0A0L0FHC3_9EUKA|nr:hypothetical protein SARC_11607 [Sphaeroforma arctica JP610]KNC75876.1 hypothetical protein SARC_11607 [Sphaeroforma arctica JP610]|eukprot:XP_014149778.1 hypothetical protein SARC_11607 [Sphaeroforma arctica JP610]
MSEFIFLRESTGSVQRIATQMLRTTKRASSRTYTATSRHATTLTSNPHTHTATFTTYATGYPGLRCVSTPWRLSSRLSTSVVRPSGFSHTQSPMHLPHHPHGNRALHSHAQSHAHVPSCTQVSRIALAKNPSTQVRRALLAENTSAHLASRYINITPRVSHYGSSTDKDYYQILGVSKSATAMEIKSAYFEQAKKVHPDMCPNDPIAAKKFKEVSEAYTVLKDKSSRNAYDAHRASPFTRSQGFNTNTQQQYAQQQQRQAWTVNGVDAEEIFKSVWKDLGFSEIKDYLAKVREEGEDALVSIRENKDFGPAWQFTKEYKALITGIVLPLALTLRFPALVGLAMRNLFLVPVVIMRALPPELRWRLMHDMWFRIVKSQQAHAHTGERDKDAKDTGKGRRRR